MDDENNGLPSQSISNIDRITMSSSCSLSLLVSVIFIAVLLLPKLPSQSRRRTTSKKLHAYPPTSASVSSSSSIATPLPSLPSQSSRPMNNVPMSIAGIDVVAVARLRRRCAAAPLSRRSSGGGSRPPGGGRRHPGGVGRQRRHICCTPPPPSPSPLPLSPLQSPPRYRHES